MDDSHSALETYAAVFTAGLIGSRPAAGPSNARGFYLATNENAPRGILYYSDGTTWVALNSFAAAGSATPGDTAAEGTATTYARSDHRHALPGYGITGEMAQVGTTASGGSVSKFARVDHVHTLADASVTAGKIAAGGVSASNQIASAIIQSYHFAPGAISEGAIAADQKIPIGSVTMYTGNTAPTGFLFCDGASYATASYSALHGIIGYKYGGAGANFNVPDFRTRLPRGANTVTTAGDLGLSGGADTITIATTNMPGHTHGVSGITVASGGSHNHTLSGSSDSASPSHTHTGTSDAGGSHSHGVSGNTGTQSADHSHSGTTNGTTQTVNQGVDVPSGFGGFVTKTTHSTIQSADNIYAHSHAFSTGGVSANHTHSFSATTDTAAAHTHTFTTGSASATHSHGMTGVTVSSHAGHSHTLSGATDSNGSGTALNVQNKYLTINYIIKI